MKNCKVLLAATVLFLFFSCSHRLQINNTIEEVIVYPSPPDTARIQFLTSISNSMHVVGKKSSFVKFVAGEDKELPIKKPYGISIQDGKIYVCDVSIGGLEILDLENHTFEYFIPSGLGKLRMPINCFVDDSGLLYIADVERRQVVIFDQNRQYIDSFGEKEKYKPTDVFVFDNKIWVANSENNRIHVYKSDSTRKFLYTFPEVEQGGEGYLFQPINLYVNNEKVYVTDFGAFNVKIYTHEGEFINSIGSYGKNLGQFARPKGIAVDRNSNLFVVDAAFENIQIFNDAGELLMFFGGSYQGPGDMWLPTTVAIDYENLKYFQQYVDKRFSLEYLILVCNQYGPDKINVYGHIVQKP